MLSEYINSAQEVLGRLTLRGLSRVPERRYQEKTSDVVYDEIGNEIKINPDDKNVIPRAYIRERAKDPEFTRRVGSDAAYDFVRFVESGVGLIGLYQMFRNGRDRAPTSIENLYKTLEAASIAMGAYRARSSSQGYG